LANKNHRFSPVLDTKKTSCFLGFREAKKLYLVYPWFLTVYENPNPEIISPVLAFYLIQSWVRSNTRERCNNLFSLLSRFGYLIWVIKYPALQKTSLDIVLTPSGFLLIPNLDKIKYKSIK
jgi:hypothetical protein